MTPPAVPATRRCHDALQSLHSTAYFTPDLDKELGGRGIGDPMARYLVGRSAPLGAVGPGVVTAAFYTFEHSMIASHLPAAWRLVSPGQAWEARLRSADATLRRALGDEVLVAKELREAARLALYAAEAGQRPGRPMYAALADLPVPDEPHLALWYAATLLREHRGDTHIGALGAAGLGGIEALVSHCASDTGMPRELVMTKRGWTSDDWGGAEERLRDAGLMHRDGTLTDRGVRLRADVEFETDRRDIAPYDHLGTAGVDRLTALVDGFIRSAAAAGIFPPPLVRFFVPDAPDTTTI